MLAQNWRAPGRPRRVFEAIDGATRCLVPRLLRDDVGPGDGRTCYCTFGHSLRRPRILIYLVSPPQDIASHLMNSFIVSFFHYFHIFVYALRISPSPIVLMHRCAAGVLRLPRVWKQRPAACQKTRCLACYGMDPISM
jgi:hypothetical protein